MPEQHVPPYATRKAARRSYFWVDYLGGGFLAVFAVVIAVSGDGGVELMYALCLLIYAVLAGLFFPVRLRGQYKMGYLSGIADAMAFGIDGDPRHISRDPHPADKLIPPHGFGKHDDV
jgi:hypothetical protein